MFHDRQAKATTGYTRFMPIAANPVEPFKNCLVFLFGNAGAGILYRENNMAFAFPGGYADLSFSGRVLVGVAQQVKQKRTQCKPVALYETFLPLEFQRLVFCLKRGVSIGANFLHQVIQVNRLQGGGVLIRRTAIQIKYLLNDMPQTFRCDIQFTDILVVIR